jgi:hypothetical protein
MARFFTGGGIDGIYRWRYSLPIHSHLVAIANTDFVHIGFDRARFCPSLPNFSPAIPPITPVQSSKQKPILVLEAGPMEEL